MLLNSINFLVFMIMVYFLFWLLPVKFRKIILLFASYFFYGYYEWKYIIILFSITLCTFVFARKMSADSREKNRLFVTCIILILGVLLYFKYFNFLLMNVIAIIKVFTGNSNSISIHQIILPIGLSFFTFQAIGYLIDVYLGRTIAEKDFIEFALFLSFFPAISSGPISRSRDLLPQLHTLDTVKYNYNSHCDGIVTILYGLFMKMVIADRLSIMVDIVWDNYKAFGGVELLIAALAYSLQIYCDFYSYSSIALGSAKLFGIQLIDNFNSPYLAKDIKDFWKRWHISLSNWLLNYIYIPLGGNKCSVARKNFNLMCTFLVSGIWHGANWTYVVWGAIHGVYQIISPYTSKFRGQLYKRICINTEEILYKVLKRVTTFLLVSIAWIFFRANSIFDAIQYIIHIFCRWHIWRLWDGTLLSQGLSLYEWVILFVAIMIVFIFDCFKYTTGESIDTVLRKQGMLFYNIAIIFFVVVLFVYGKYGSGYDAQNFIYFQF